MQVGKRYFNQFFSSCFFSLTIIAVFQISRSSHAIGRQRGLCQGPLGGQPQGPIGVPPQDWQSKCFEFQILCSLLCLTTLSDFLISIWKPCQDPAAVFTSQNLPQSESPSSFHFFMDSCYSLVYAVPSFLVISPIPHVSKSCTINPALLQRVKLFVCVWFEICSRLVIGRVTSVRKDWPQP